MCENKNHWNTRTIEVNFIFDKRYFIDIFDVRHVGYFKNVMCCYFIWITINNFRVLENLFHITMHKVIQMYSIKNAQNTSLQGKARLKKNLSRTDITTQYWYLFNWNILKTHLDVYSEKLMLIHYMLYINYIK